MQSMSAQKTESRIKTRPPIVVVMGHIDHGKTTILDWYRKSAIAQGESGGITQHIGAYAVEYEGKHITFIDTPGHEAFTKIRSRGVKAADIAIIVVAADEGVKPQTKEALEIVKTSGLPFVVAINKIDKPEANPERVKQELAQEDVLVESYGGKVPSVETSAKTGHNMNELLETVTLLAELEDLKADPAKPAEGLVIETHRDPRRGITATLLVRDGTMTRTDVLVIGRVLETIKVFEDFRGGNLHSAGPSSPVIIAGLSNVPAVGDMFRAFRSRDDAARYTEKLPAAQDITRNDKYTQGAVDRPASAEAMAGKPVFNVILKTDVVGSKEALEESLRKFESEKIALQILRSEVGDVNEDDANMAMATKNVTVIGFRVRIDAGGREIARKSGIRIITGDIIYQLLEEVRKCMADILPPITQRTDLGKVKILKFFKKESAKQIIGGRTDGGHISKGADFEVMRNATPIGKGKVIRLQREKTEVEDVPPGTECGIMVDATVTIREGDTLAVYREEKIKQTL